MDASKAKPSSDSKPKAQYTGSQQFMSMLLSLLFFLPSRLTLLAVNFLMGGVAGAIAKTGSAPIERVKILIQNQGAMIASGRLAAPYGGIVDCFQRTYATEGLWSCTSMCRSPLHSLTSIFQSGAATRPMSSGTSPPRRSTSPSEYVLVHARWSAACSLSAGHVPQALAVQEERELGPLVRRQPRLWRSGWCCILGLRLLSRLVRCRMWIAFAHAHPSSVRGRGSPPTRARRALVERASSLALSMSTSRR